MGYNYVVVDSLGKFVRGFIKWTDAQSFWISRGGAMSGWRIQPRVSRY